MPASKRAMQFVSAWAHAHGHLEPAERVLASSPGCSRDSGGTLGMVQRMTGTPERSGVGGSPPRRLVSAELQRRRKGVSPETGSFGLVL